MKLNCSQSKLAEAVTNVQRAVSSKTSLPALEGILIKAYKNNLITKIEPLYKGSKSINVDGVTILEPMIPDKNTCSPAGMSVYAELIRIMKESTTEYYNMRLALGLECA